MLVMPQGGSYNAFMVSFDPGSVKLGVAIRSFNVYTLETTSTEAFTLDGAKLMNKHAWINHIHGDRFARIDALRQAIFDVLCRFRPLLITAESPFFNPGRPMAFGALTEVLSAIRYAVWDYDAWATLHLIDPPTIKKAVGAKGGSGKDIIRTAVLAMEAQLRYMGSIPLDQLDEHAIDAIAVGEARFKQYVEELCLK